MSASQSSHGMVGNFQMVTMPCFSTLATTVVIANHEFTTAFGFGQFGWCVFCARGSPAGSVCMRRFPVASFCPSARAFFWNI